MPSLTSPFGLISRLRKPDSNLDATALATVLISALMLSQLVGTRFVYAPGITIGINGDGPKAAAKLELPTSPGLRLAGAQTTATVTIPILAIKQDDMVIWDGRIRTLDALKKEFAAKPLRSGESRGILLVKADRSVSVQTLFDVVTLATAAGFSSVHLAGEDNKPLH